MAVQMHRIYFIIGKIRFELETITSPLGFIVELHSFRQVHEYLKFLGRIYRREKRLRRTDSW